MIHALFHIPPNASQKRCYDCFYSQAAHSWWCVNKKAIKARGTNFTGVRNCLFWAPAQTINEVPADQRCNNNYIIFDNRSNEARKMQSEILSDLQAESPA